MIRPLSQFDVVRLFGDPFGFVREDGTVDAAWEDLILGHANLPAPLPLSWDASKKVGRFRCHVKAVAVFQKALQAVHAEPDVWATIGDFGGCYNWRTQRRSKVLSRHCWGIAIDIDVKDNPMGSEPAVHPRLVTIMEGHGIAWGGYFHGSRRDPMHFEIGASRDA